MPWFGRDERRRAIEEIKDVKWRQWVLMPSIPVTIAALIVNTIVTIDALESFADYSNEDTGKFSFYDIPDGPIRSKVVTAVSLQVILLAVLWAETIHFSIFFHRDDRVHRRCAELTCITIQASLSLALLLFAVGLKIVDDQIVTIPLTTDISSSRRPELTAEQFNAAYGSWRKFVISQTGLIVFLVAIADAGIHVVAVIFWLWLLPARHRLPNRYEPVVKVKKRTRTVGGSPRSSYELVDSAESVGVGPLEAVFKEHERIRLLNANSPLNNHRKTTKEPLLTSLRDEGPKFDPIVRYWMINPLRDGAWAVTAVFVAFFLVDPIFEVVFFALTKIHGLRCRWQVATAS
ncbi:hypothetical protein NPX13_g7234 [Xylaria arbuscula]|uniref:Uncharacterized protein n=1 Tax=Xylaria arbuscula TaxID=114810 RepID=A0A9W8TJN5_9PEZI|nr:hypothetical protein NPX13_g7234 [Xylaria arbuscula]